MKLIAVVFNPKIWKEKGYDIGRNEHCYQEAIIKRIERSSYGEWIATVIWPNGTESKGHFLDAMKNFRIHKEREND